MDIFEVGDTVQPALEAIKDGGKKKNNPGRNVRLCVVANVS
jgi:hypothetical protein